MKKNEAMNFVMGETIGYTRVSSREQEENGFSIRQQAEAIIEYADMLGYEVKPENIVADPGKSAGTLKRKGLQAILKELPKGKIKRIIVKNSSRLTRDNLGKYSLKKVFERYGIDIICIEGKWQADNVNEEIGTDIQVFIDSHNRKQVSPDTIKGMKQSALEGNYSLGGKPPRGYRKIRKENNSVFLEPIQEYKEHIIYIFESLKQRSNTLQGIAKLFNKEKVMGKYWTDFAVRRIFNNPIYYGAFRFRDIYIENHTEAIISKELYMAAHKSQEVLTRVPKHLYVYGGLVFCKNCNTYCVKESVVKKEKVYIYYRCPSCGKRINETKIDKRASVLIDLRALPKEKYDLIVELEKKVKRKQSRINCYERDYDEFLIEEEELKEKTVKVRREIQQFRNEIELIKGRRTKRFDSFSGLEKYKLIHKKLETVIVDFETMSIDCVERT